MKKAGFIFLWILAIIFFPITLVAILITKGALGSSKDNKGSK